MYLCGLFDSLFHIRSKYITRKQKSRFLQLPLELLLDIWDEVQLPETILLSQVCRALRDTLHARCLSAYAQATSKECLRSLAILGNIPPDHRSCTRCLALHPINPKDLPSAYGLDYRQSCPAPEPARSCHEMMPVYAIAFQHVQLAMKYTHLQHHHQDYRANLMRKFTSTWPSICPRRLRFIAEPRIIQGKLFLMAAIIYNQKSESSLLFNLSRANLSLCAHIGLKGAVSQDSDVLLSAVRRASQMADDPYGSIRDIYSCDKCPTDYSIHYEQEKAIFCVWQDLGAGASPADPYRQSHL